MGELTKAWFNTARQYLELAKKPLKDVVLRQLFQPWKLSNLQEHEACFQQWNVIQLWIGIISTLMVLLMNLIWCLAEDNALAKPSMGSVFVNAIVGLLLVAFFTHLAWFGVISKDGCCCGIFALIHSVSLLYVGFEAAMIWKLSTSTAVPDTSETKKADVIGAAQVVTDAEAGQTKVEA